MSEPSPNDAPLDATYVVTDAQREALERDGHVLLPGVVSAAELASYREAIVEAAERQHRESDEMKRRLYMLDSLWERSDVVRRFVMAKRFAKIAADLLRVDAVRLWRDVAFFKSPGDDATPWHQDLHWEPIESDRFASLWIALGDVSGEMAPLTFASGSHRGGEAAIAEHEGRAQENVTRWIHERGHAVVNHAPLGAGDATMHLGWTLHSSPRNASDRRREAIALIYYADGARIAVRPRESSDAVWLATQAFHMAHRFPDAKPGDPAVSERCPVVFRRDAV